MPDTLLPSTLSAKRISPDVRHAIQESPLSIRALARQFAIDPKTVRRWRNRTTTQAARTGPRAGHKHVVTGALEFAAIAIRRHLRLPIDDCLYVLQHFQPKLSRATLHRRFRDHGLSRLAIVPKRPPTAGWFNVALCDISSEASPRFVLIAVELESRYLFAQVYSEPVGTAAEAFLRDLTENAPITICGAFIAPTVHRREIEAACRAVSIGCRRAPSLWGEDQRQTTQAAKEMAELSLTECRGKLSAGAKLYNSRCRLKVLGGKTPLDTLHRHGKVLPVPSADTSIRLSRTSVGAQTAPSTREIILDCARTLLANGGPEGLTMSKVARSAGLSRGTIYQHFGSRADLAADAARWSSRQLTEAVFAQDAPANGTAYESTDVLRVMTRLADFAIGNPVMGQAWLFQVLSSPKPAEDEFWREYFARSEQFHETPMAAQNIDTEVLSVILLAGTFLWAQWARSRFDTKADLDAAAHRYVKEFMRLALHGTLNKDYFERSKALDVDQ